MITKEKLEWLFYDQEGNISMPGSDGDKKVLKEIILEVEKLEHYVKILKEIVRHDNKVIINCQLTPKEKFEFVLGMWNIFKDFPD